MTLRKRLLWSGLACALILGLYQVWLTLDLGGERVTVGVSDFGLVAGSGAAAICCAFAARRQTGRTRRAWILMTGAMLAWMTGESIWSYYEVIAQREAPFPSLADIGYLAAIPIAAAAMLILPAASTRSVSRVRAVLDGLVIVGALLIVSWVSVLRTLVRSSQEGLLAQAIGIAYPAGDIVILTAVLYVLARSDKHVRTPSMLLALGLSALAIADSGYTYLTLNDTYESGGPIDGAWMAGYLLIAVAAIASRPASATFEREHRFTRLGAAVPYGAILVALFVAALERATTGAIDTVTFWSALGLVILVVSRQFLTRLDNVALNRTLEDRVRIRTEELDRALRDLRTAKAREDAFIASTHHELRTPMTTIIGATKTLLSRNHVEDGYVRELLEMTHRAGMRMSGLVEELLTVAGLDDELHNESVPTDLSELVDQAVVSLRAQGRNVQASVPRPLVAVADPARVETILAHLLANSAKFTPPGSPITIEGVASGAVAQLIVRDEGPGIPKEHHDKIFERFYQVDGSLTREQGGVGLGLFVSRALAEAMGGTLTLDSETPRGAAFRLQLPLSASHS